MMGGGGFLGRQRELAAIGRALSAAREGGGALVLVDGEPGIGKTALAGEVARRAGADGWKVAWGAGLEGSQAPAYWPWMQVLRDLGASAEQLVTPATEDAEPSARFRLFDEVVEILRQACPSGLLVVLDDLHWAGPAALRLLQILAAEVGAHPMLVLGLYRGTDVAAGDPSAAMSAISRERACTRLSLGGLGAAELAQLAAATLNEPDDRLLHAVQQRSEGNPFFALELLRLADESGSVDSAPPPGIREVIGRRIDLLEPATRQVLREAAVLGRDFAVDGLSKLSGQPSLAILEQLDEANARALVTEVDGTQFRFAHALTQEVAYAELSTAQRQRLHVRAAEVLGEDKVDAVAHHLRHATALGTAGEALDATLRAARRARNQLAFEHAAFQLRQALDLLPLLPDPSVTRAELLLDLARCQFRSGAVSAAWASCREAAELGRAVGDPALMADAATVLRGISNSAVDPVCDEINALCRQTLTMLADDPVRQAKLYAQQAITTDAFASDGTTGLSERAVRLAEAAGDLDARFMALQARQVQLVHPRFLLERLTNGEHAVRLGEETGRDDYLAWGRLWRADAFWELGRRPQLDRELAEYAKIVARMKEPLHRWRLTSVKACLAELHGRFADALSLADEARLIGRRNGHDGADFVHLIFRSRIARLNGDGAEDVVREVRQFADAGPAGAYGWLASQLVEMGELAEAAEVFRNVEPYAVRVPQHAPEWIPAMTGTASVCVRLRRADLAAEIYSALLPFADRQVVAGAFTGSDGPVARHLGMLATLLGDFHAAEAHLQAALASTAAMASPPYEALTREEIARLLVARDEPGDRREAEQELDRALSLARRLGMKPLQRRAAEIRSACHDRSGTPLSGREQELAALIAEGLSNRQIAQRLVLSERTVESHVRNILTKLDLSNRTQIAAWVNTRLGD